jgi:hypothetical protein
MAKLKNLTFALSCFALLGITTFVNAQQSNSGSSVIKPTGVVDISKLPPSSGQPSGIKTRGRHFPEPALLASEKAALSKGGGKPKPSPSPSSSPTATPTPSFTLGTSFNGIGLLASGGYVPPDTTVAANSNYVFEAVNLEGEVFSKTGGAVKSFSLYNFFGISTSSSITDPRVLHDDAGGHWYVLTSTFGPNSAYGWNLAVSQTDDPTGSWWIYIIPTANLGSFPDFPKMGYSADKVVITGDAFSGNTFMGTEFVVFNKSELTSGSDTHMNFFTPDQGDFAIEPAQHLDPVGAASNDGTLFMASVADPSANSIEVWRVTGVPTGTAAASFSRASLPINSLSTPPNAAQAGTSKLVDTNDNALLDAVFRDGSPGSLWVSANDGCKPAGDTSVRSCVRLIEVSILNGAASVAQDFDYSAAGKYFFYPAIRTDNSGNLFAVFNGSSASQNISVYGAIQRATDPSDTLRTPALLKSGTNAYTESARWGDYSGAGFDSSNGSIWLGGEYPTSCGFLVPSCWGTWIENVSP